MDGLNTRIRSRLREIGKSMRRASMDGGLSAEAVSKILSKPEHSPTLETIEKLAKGLGTTPPWLAYGVTHDGTPATPSTGASISINVALLKQAVEFVLVHEGVDADRAALVADILPEALLGPPVDAVERDPFLSFRVHLQLEEQRSASPA